MKYLAGFHGRISINAVLLYAAGERIQFLVKNVVRGTLNVISDDDS